MAVAVSDMLLVLVAMVEIFLDDNAICYVLSVLWIMSFGIYRLMVKTCQFTTKCNGDRDTTLKLQVSFW